MVGAEGYGKKGTMQVLVMALDSSRQCRYVHGALRHSMFQVGQRFIVARLEAKESSMASIRSRRVVGVIGVTRVRFH
jgi:hypothetical protein